MSLNELQRVNNTIVSCYTKHLSEKFNINNKLNFSSCLDRFAKNVTNDISRKHTMIMKDYFINNNNKEDTDMIFNSIPKHVPE